MIAGRVRTAQSDIHLRRVELDLARAEAASLEELSRDVDRRVAAGDLARADALAAQAEWLAALARSAQAGEQETQARLRWRSHGQLLFTNWLNHEVYQPTSLPV